jgi:hypothetical protein
VGISLSTAEGENCDLGRSVGGDGRGEQLCLKRASSIKSRCLRMDE